MNSGLSGNIPPELGNLSNLVNASLRHNQLTGALPSTLGNLSSLRTLYLDKNQLTGSIPPELGDLVNLTPFFLTSDLDVFQHAVAQKPSKKCRHINHLDRLATNPGETTGLERHDGLGLSRVERSGRDG